MRAHDEVLEALRHDGSWQFTPAADGTPDRAVFRLDPATRPGRRDLVRRLPAHAPGPGGGAAPADPSDPEQWEGVLVAALLAHPAADRLRVLDLRLTDYHRCAEPVAAALAARPRPRLEHLSFGYGYRHLYEDAEGTAGTRIDPLDFHGEGLVQSDVWPALPALRTLELEGAFLFHAVDHDGLTHLKVRGPACSDGAVFALGHTPAVESLTVEVGCDVFGVTLSPDQLGELTADRYPALRRLDLARTEFDADPHEVLAALADCDVLPQLDTLTLDARTAGARTPDLAPRFAHLDLRTAV
ncbi:hypothetical protein ACFV0O_36735 [Kitasatospora sp. NPDC059577]|uniref:hypothetical protein n=1 Tax=unclassified Kitasatospora TaxID=2633591 RepID=UPI00368B0E67